MRNDNRTVFRARVASVMGRAAPATESNCASVSRAHIRVWDGHRPWGSATPSGTTAPATEDCGAIAVAGARDVVEAPAASRALDLVVASMYKSFFKPGF
jgi:hypothetical protein